ncbi:hypothetical protein C8R46DRAFT_1117758 [Mycena filopes]|nr:hypothetical protein C8R46DRAFT_1117758 [Mycena filopes]
MTNCSICLEAFTSPVSLPCGHVFCRECIRRTVDAVKSRATTTTHLCPTCRKPYSIVTLDPKLVPPYLRPHIQPPIRKLFIDNNDASAPPGSSPSSTPAAPTPAPVQGSAADLGRALAEAHALRQHCATWRHRAESHAMGNAALLALSRAAKDCALRMRAERDAERSQCVLLKRKLAELMPESELLDPDTATATEPRGGCDRGRAAPPGAGLPVFLAQMHCKPAERFYDNPVDMTRSRLGPPLKRRCPNRDSTQSSFDAPLPTKAPDSACDSIFVKSTFDFLAPTTAQ